MDDFNNSAQYQPGFNTTPSPKEAAVVKANCDGSFAVKLTDSGLLEDYAATVQTAEGCELTNDAGAVAAVGAAVFYESGPDTPWAYWPAQVVVKTARTGGRCTAHIVRAP